MKKYSLKNARIIFLLIILGFLISQGCKKNPLAPSEGTPGRRDYTWTVDTIKIPFNYLGRITGSGPNDVYAVGPGGGLDETIWHYDGNRWSTDGVSRLISPHCIFSLGVNDVWIAGSEGRVWHYDGGNWSESLDFKKDNYVVGFQDIWGESSQNIYAVGYADSGDTRSGIILHYDGKTWQEELIPNFPYCFGRMGKDINGNHKYYLFGTNYSNDGYFLGLFEYDGRVNMTKIYEKLYDLNTYPGFQLIDNKMYFTLGRTINTYEYSYFKWLMNINGEKFIAHLYGRSLSDMLYIMSDGIEQYNGTDEQYIYRYSNIQFTDAVLFDNAIFLVATDFTNNQNVMIKGVLK
jgi:hypothetical protein